MTEPTNTTPAPTPATVAEVMAQLAEADKARADAAGKAKNHDQRADYTLGLRPKVPGDMCASMQALGDEWLQGRAQK